LHHHVILPAVDLLGFLTLGLLGGFGHCVGMCSPFVLFVSRRYGPSEAGLPPSPPGDCGVASRAGRWRGRRGVFVAQAWYAAGRILTYAVLGAAAGALGGVVELAGALVGVQRAASILAGGVLVAWALAALSDLARFDAGGTLFGRMVALLKGRVPGHPFATGLFLGLLPCGFLYSAVVAAVARGGAPQGAAALALFGLGTAPALVGVSLADEFLARNRVFVNRLSQVFILAMGGWFLWRGLAGQS
jgi:uncharacterized protein